MDFKELTKGRFTGAEVSTGNQPSLLPREPNTPPYKAGEVDPNRMEPQEVYLPYGKTHAAKFGVKVVLTLMQALELRRKKLAVVTSREADIAARLQIPLNSDFMHKGMQAIDGMFAEGIPGEKDNAYVLREFYNRGIKFKKEFYHKATKEKQETADKAMRETLMKLTEIGLPAWPEEVENGFAVELCKPEFMSWDQYLEASKHYIFRDPENFNPAKSETTNEHASEPQLPSSSQHAASAWSD
jgi:hypothetical protein